MQSANWKWLPLSCFYCICTDLSLYGNHSNGTKLSWGEFYLMMIKRADSMLSSLFHWSSNGLLNSCVKAAVLTGPQKMSHFCTNFMEYMKNFLYCTLNLVKWNWEYYMLIKLAKIFSSINTQVVRKMCIELWMTVKFQCFLQIQIVCGCAEVHKHQHKVRGYNSSKYRLFKTTTDCLLGQRHRLVGVAPLCGTTSVSSATVLCFKGEKAQKCDYNVF